MRSLQPGRSAVICNRCQAIPIPPCAASGVLAPGAVIMDGTRRSGLQPTSALHQGAIPRAPVRAGFALGSALPFPNGEGARSCRGRSAGARAGAGGGPVFPAPTRERSGAGRSVVRPGRLGGRTAWWPHRLAPAARPKGARESQRGLRAGSECPLLCSPHLTPARPLASGRSRGFIR